MLIAAGALGGVGLALDAARTGPFDDDPDAVYDGRTDGPTIGALYISAAMGSQFAATATGMGAGFLGYGLARRRAGRTRLTIVPGDVRLQL